MGGDLVFVVMDFSFWCCGCREVSEGLPRFDFVPTLEARRLIYPARDRTRPAAIGCLRPSDIFREADRKAGCLDGNGSRRGKFTTNLSRASVPDGFGLVRRDGKR